MQLNSARMKVDKRNTTAVCSHMDHNSRTVAEKSSKTSAKKYDNMGNKRKCTKSSLIIKSIIH